MKKPFAKTTLAAVGFLLVIAVHAQQKYILEPDRVFDGEQLHSGWVVVVTGDKITAAGVPSQLNLPPEATTLKLPGCTLLPGLIEGHSHLLLHPYNETPWDDQVLKESDALRVARATVHAEKTLRAGFTTTRDLGSEGAGYADVGLKQAINQNIIPGPRMLVAGRAIVATGSYGPKGFDTDFTVMLGAEQADGPNLIQVVRDQIGKGADIVKVYADYRWGLKEEAQPTFSVEELKLVVETAKSSGRPVVAHAVTAEGMRRAAVAGVETIEHGDNGTPEVFRLMKEKGIALCPTLAAGASIAQYRGWKKDSQPEPERLVQKRQTFQEALKAGVVICAGGDVGVFAHGQNAYELELMVAYGMNPLEVLRSATSVNAKVFHLDKEVGRIKENLKADILVVKGDPSKNISDLRQVKWVMKDGVLYE
ncbi:metal-dependent hydrolase family protein [Chryseolinea soli]|uniref:Amidohydrolase family protein n=1 Tax=Chryseolinea soli TaxID=2321403 RepID=A0A385SG42_9BACT|nr:amidohydrolase family protein [Chryseolinea soli]AYB30713.1 amidohydrolase family protein [Chryseolinea soli]